MDTYHCPKCGAPIADEDTLRCPCCGGSAVERTELRREICAHEDLVLEQHGLTPGEHYISSVRPEGPYVMACTVRTLSGAFAGEIYVRSEDLPQPKPVSIIEILDGHGYAGYLLSPGVAVAYDPIYEGVEGARRVVGHSEVILRSALDAARFVCARAQARACAGT